MLTTIGYKAAACIICVEKYIGALSLSSIAIIIGSTRPNRIGRQVAEWVKSVLPASDELSFELIDLADWNLPLLDEPVMAARGSYANEHTKAWSEKIARYDGFIFVTPQYNWGYPASLKNALDYLYAEWNGKPAVIISYGYRGGGKAAAQLSQVLEGLRMRPVETMPAITTGDEMRGENSMLKSAENDLEPYRTVVQSAAQELSATLNGV